MPTVRNTDLQGRLDSWQNPSRSDGYTFAYWSPLRDGGVPMPTIFTAHTTLYAQWNPPGVFVITLFVNGGNALTPNTLNTNSEGRLTAPLPIPTRPNHTFDGWFIQNTAGNNIPVTADTVFTANIAILAMWTLVPVELTITAHPNGGAVSHPTVLTDQFGRLTLADMPAATRSGFTFAGWFTAAEGGARVLFGTNGTVYTEDATVYAQWSPVTITFAPNLGTVTPATLTVGTDGRLAALPVPTRDGAFVFNGWFTARAGGERITTDTVFTRNTTVQAQWSATQTPQSFMITLDPNNGIPLIMPRVLYTDANGRLTEPIDNPSRMGFSFSGWFTAPTGGTRVNTGTVGTVFTSDSTIYAQWSAVTVTFNLNGGNSGSAPANAVVSPQNGRLATLPTPTRTGFTFVGWYTAQVEGTEVTAERVYGVNTTIWARWVSSTPGTFTITLAAGNEIAVSTLATRADGRLAALPEPTSPFGAIFTGWFPTSGYASPGTTGRITAGANGTVFTEDTTIYANWQYVPPPFE
jgi:uncharacterized repeat protein (TIGR02543 family)